MMPGRRRDAGRRACASPRIPRARIRRLWDKSVALLDQHVALRHPRRRSAAAAGGAADLLDHLPILLGRADTRARRLLDSRRAAEMVEVAVTDEDVLDVLEIEAQRPDVVDHMIDKRLLRRIDHDDPLRCRDEPGVHVAQADMVEIVERLERRDLVLKLDVAAVAIDLAQRLLSRRLLGEHTIAEVGIRQQSGERNRREQDHAFRGHFPSLA
jgi:hypothetical protein